MGVVLIIIGTSVLQATGHYDKESNGYFYHHFDGVADVYTSSI